MTAMMGEVGKYGYDGSGIRLRLANTEGAAEVLKPFERRWTPDGEKYDLPGTHVLRAETIVRLRAGSSYTFRFEVRIDNRRGTSGVTFVEDPSDSTRLIAEPL